MGFSLIVARGSLENNWHLPSPWKNPTEIFTIFRGPVLGRISNLKFLKLQSLQSTSEIPGVFVKMPSQAFAAGAQNTAFKYIPRCLWDAL